ncbi:MAG: MaoC domain protein dehydratase, partial [Nocardioides sp.]|nr:MaoC domain protein dehydratase [Nocardioides sp.]
IVLRTVTDDLLGGDAAQVAGFAARFAGVVFPGETIRVQAWDAGTASDQDRIVVSATIASSREERDGAPVLADCVVTRA